MFLSTKFIEERNNDNKTRISDQNNIYMTVFGQVSCFGSS